MKTTRTYENQDSASDCAKNEDPAKMTYSIPDFVSRQHNPEPRILPSIREHLTKIQDQDLERCESSVERGFIFQLPRGRDRSDRMIENEIVYVFTQSQRRRPTNGPVGRTHRIRTIGLAYCGTVALSVPPNHPTSLFSTPHTVSRSLARARVHLVCWHRIILRGTVGPACRDP